MKNLKLKFFGLVQGVNFRQNFKAQAEKRNLNGYVFNSENGSVTAEVEGEEDKIYDFLSWAQKGTFPAKVMAMNIQWSDEIKGYKDFKIERKGNYLLDRAKGVVNLGYKLVRKPEEFNTPKHVVVIPDGNRRWARSKGWKAFVGHEKGIDYKRIKAMFEVAKEFNVEYFSLWGFSTENWDRSEEEITFLWNLFRKNIKEWKKDFVKEDIRFRHFGRKDRLPSDIIELMKELEEETKELDGFNFQLCLDYGGRDDVIRAVNKGIKEGVREFDDKLISEYLDTGNVVPDPDLIIRTSGEQRTSGILAYQGVYAELYFAQKSFPDFGAEDLRLAILDYSGRTRRFGGTAKSDLKGIDLDSLSVPLAEAKN